MAERLKVDVVDSYAHGDEKDLAKEVLGQPESTLIVWHHGTLSKLVRHFPIVNQDDVPKHWPEERFDLIWVLVRQPGAEPSTASSSCRKCSWSTTRKASEQMRDV